MVDSVILSIAGSDPSGGAGIQADLKTFCRIGVFGCAAISCLTAQNSQGVKAVMAVDEEFVFQQIVSVLEDMPVSHVKIGMVGNSGAASAIGKALKSFQGQIICDPIFRATDGHSLLKTNAFPFFEEHILCRSTVLTPNRLEIEQLTGESIQSSETARKTAKKLFSQYPRLEAVALTGGHLDEELGIITDHLYTRKKCKKGCIYESSAMHPRRTTANTHGTGCTFASAYGAYHMLTGSHQEAFQAAVHFVDSILAGAGSSQLGHGYGPVLHHLFGAS